MSLIYFIFLKCVQNFVASCIKLVELTIVTSKMLLDIQLLQSVKTGWIGNLKCYLMVALSSQEKVGLEKEERIVLPLTCSFPDTHVLRTKPGLSTTGWNDIWWSSRCKFCL